MTHLALSSVHFAHEGGRPVLADVSFSAPRGSFVLLTGPSGAGKSTLLRLFCRLEEPQQGQVLLGGQNVSELPPTQLRRRVSYLQQTPTVIPGSVRDNLLLPFSFKAASLQPRPDDAALLALLAGLAASDVPLGQEASTLSVGQRQRLCLARALLTRPEALLLDEPTSALDPESAGAVLAAAESFCLDHGGTVVLVSHAEFRPERVAPLAFALQGGSLEQRSPA
ncbi:MAG: ABC transporter ATP-binding protein [Humidesulfovibrio sp.]|uniref:ABC transporter ATP-binding protein n=1 Tax=Humidesulfovibrio sp. TaxID=2910988 RepID=UPI0027FCADA3|nr:ABC transporter ATP-binding protein [Humidesulfovibrio sp.]MDQ7836172.1 ABC transporter ATP-binding protein [Humidesulfovibrio sp.]